MELGLQKKRATKVFAFAVNINGERRGTCNGGSGKYEERKMVE